MREQVTRVRASAVEGAASQKLVAPLAVPLLHPSTALAKGVDTMDWDDEDEAL